MALNGTAMAGAVVDALVTAGKYPGLNAAQIQQIKDDMAIAHTAMVAYIVANLEINGIQISDPATEVEGFGTGATPPLLPGVGSNGGTLTGQIPVNGKVKKAAQTLDQSNSGTGLIA